MTRIAVVLSSAALVAVSGAGASLQRGTLTGVVTRGPITPVCALEQPCDEPAAHVTLVFTHDGTVAGRVTTNDAGRYRVRLPAASYSVRRASVAAPDRRLEPRNVRLRAGALIRIDFSIDTGIR
jgi:hypothetical protein